MSRDLYRLQDAARLTGLSVSTLRRRIRSGELQTHHKGETSPHLVERAELQRLAIAETGRDPFAMSGTAEALSPAVIDAIRQIVREEIARAERSRSE